ncbi:MAG TPA: hypothetical protein VIS27_09555 [Yeosuana sp.]
MEKKLDEISVHLAEIKSDLKYHISRTDKLESLVVPIHKSHVFISYCVKSLVPLGAILGIIYKIKELLS